MAGNETVDEKFSNTFAEELGSMIGITLLDVGEVLVEDSRITVRVDDEHVIYIDVKGVHVDRPTRKLRRPRTSKLRLVKG